MMGSRQMIVRSVEVIETMTSVLSIVEETIKG